MEDKSLAPGDTVVLKSGGPAMTVQWYEDDNGQMRAYCIWFDSKNIQQGAQFAPETLKKIDV